MLEFSRRACSYDGGHITHREEAETVSSKKSGKAGPEPSPDEHSSSSHDASPDLQGQIDFANAIIETAQVIILVLDNKARIVRFNPCMEEISGFTLEEVAGKDWFTTFLPKRDYSRIRKRFIETIGNIDTRGTINPIITKDGRERLIEWHNRPLKDSDGEVIGVLAIGHDITERVQAEGALRRSEAQMDAILDGITSKIAFVNPDLELMWVNRVAADSAGKTIEEMLGRKCHVLLCGWDKPCDECPCLTAFETRVAQHSVIQSADHKWWDIRAEPVFDENNDLVGAMAIAQDITDRLKTEEEKERLESELLQAQKMEAVGRLAGGIAHDFNNLLTGILGNVSLAQINLDADSPVYSSLTEIRTASMRAAALTRQLLAFSRKHIMKARIVDLNELVTGMDKMLRPIIGEDVQLKTSPREDIGSINADPGQIEQVILNMAINARDAMPGGGKLTIATDEVEYDEKMWNLHPDMKQGRYVVLTVTDTGHGMDDDTMSHVFDPFFTTKQDDKGTGLGLSTAYGIIKQHSGFIYVYSEVGVGTVFKIYFPWVGEAAESVAAPPWPEAIPGGTETVLVVEDEPTVKNIVIKVLRTLGYNVLAAESGAGALELVREPSPSIDLLLTDIIMPNMNGRKLADELHKLCPKARVLYTSGYTESLIAHHGVLDEDIQFIGKPYTPQALAAKLREILDD